MLTTRHLVAPFDTFGRDDVLVAGGKGANLGELTRAGFPVPPGFVVTTHAYDLAIQQAVLDACIASAIQRMDTADADSAASASVAIQEAFAAAPVPPDVAAAVLAASRVLGAGPAAVRSSATAEDLPSAAFAGQQETYLNVEGDAALLTAIRQCWASLWSERAIAYRTHRRVDQSNVKLAVVVQRMVVADVAGVLFTANPVTGARDELVLDASPGLGEAVVAGLVTPDHFVLDKPSLAIKERRLGRREAVVRPLASGGTEQRQPEGQRQEVQPCLPDAAIAALAGLGMAVERHYDAPQDVEWAWAAGKPYLLQARPLTALPPAPAPAPRTGSPSRPRRRLPIAGFLGELFPIRPFPLDISSYTSTLIAGLFKEMFAPIGVRFPTPAELFVEEDGVVVHIADLNMRPTPRLLYQPWLTLWQNRRYDLAHWHDDPIIAEGLRRASDLQARDLTALSWDDLLHTLRAALAIGPFVAILRRRYIAPILRDTLVLWLLLAFARQRARFGILLSGVETKTLAMNRDLEALADQVRASSVVRALFATTPAPDLLPTLEARPEAQAFLRAFQAFLDVYGHRPVLEMLASQPAWRNAPAIPLGAIQALAAAPDAGTTKASQPERPPAWQRVRDELVAHSILGRGALRPLFLRALDGARHVPELREDTRFYFTLGLPVVHASFLELGRRLALAGALAVADDVLHLKLAEIEAAGRPWPPSADVKARLRSLVARRKEKREALTGQPFLSVTAPELADARSATGAVLSGLPGSAGVAEGPVRIIGGPTAFGTLRPGEVLVAPFTNPTWTPIFRFAAAVVVDTGAPLSHAAIVAREYGIPAVMGTVDGTRRLHDGQRVRVDGTRGLVFLIPAHP